MKTLTRNSKTKNATFFQCSRVKTEEKSAVLGYKTLCYIRLIVSVSLMSLANNLPQGQSIIDALKATYTVLLALTLC